jgi:superfamily II DNA or RNA helicase
MQKPLHTGDLVTVRRSRWRVVDVRSYEACAVVTLQGTTPAVAGAIRRVLSPFEAIEPIDRARRARFVGPRKWRRACRAAIAADVPAGGLVAAAGAAIDLFAYQLEPALAVVRGLATRLLLADEVGLGKTIQAGLVASELIARRSADRVLVLTPAGLRDQWVDELSRRFGLESVRVDARMLRRTAAALPIGVNPWTTIGVAVASIDYVKRAEVVASATSIRWDLVIVDEAHTVAADSERRAAADALASRAPYVLLLTATPHSGDRGLFASLCAIGAVDDSPLAVFRRTRSDAGITARRRVHVAQLAANAAERRMHARLIQYANAVGTERRSIRGADTLLALGVLHKRMLSSAWSLAESVGRRLQAISDPADVDDREQLMLPLGDLTGELTDADQPPPWPSSLALADRDRERRLLTTLLASAREASRDETKLRRLARLLRRTREPVVVFTEYRDTLLHVLRGMTRPTVVLHGGLRREERADALRRFAATPHVVLLATDAAAEGLNLHHHCRIVVNLELPWNPNRLEQRIGRVDRLGQRWPVHAFHLVSATAGETVVLERLRARIAVAAADVHAANPLANAADEHAIAQLIFARGAGDEHDDDGPERGGER